MQAHVCVRLDATRSFSASRRAKIVHSADAAKNRSLTELRGYDCFPVVESVTPAGETRAADPAFGNRAFSRER